MEEDCHQLKIITASSVSRINFLSCVSQRKQNEDSNLFPNGSLTKVEQYIFKVEYSVCNYAE